MMLKLPQMIASPALLCGLLLAAGCGSSAPAAVVPGCIFPDGGAPSSVDVAPVADTGPAGDAAAPDDASPADAAPAVDAMTTPDAMSGDDTVLTAPDGG